MPWGCTCPFQALPPRGSSVLGLCALLPSQAPSGAFGRGCGCEWSPLPRPPLESSREAQHCPPRLPRGTASLQACSPTSWRSRSAGEVLVGAHFITGEKCSGSAGEQGGGGGGGGDSRVGGAERRARQGASYLSSDFSPRLGGFAPQEASWVPSGTPAAEPTAARKAQGLLLRLRVMGGLFGAPVKLLFLRVAVDSVWRGGWSAGAVGGAPGFGSRAGQALPWGSVVTSRRLSPCTGGRAGGQASPTGWPSPPS